MIDTLKDVNRRKLQVSTNLPEKMLKNEIKLKFMLLKVSLCNSNT